MRTNRLFARVWQVFAMHMCALSALYAADGEVMVGSISGNLEATLTGAATYTIPIECPTGVGMQPTLSLVYNSQSGKGLAGMGWNLTGLSSIMRTVHTSYNDGKGKGIAWDCTDPLSLDGKRLIPEEEWGTDSVQYRLEDDPSVLVRAYTLQSWGPSYLKAFTKDGVVMTYGNPQVPTSYLLSYSDALTQSSPMKLGWNLVEVTDANGNYMKINYIHTLGGAVGNVIHSILYGGNKRKGNTTPLIIYFDYEKRMDDIRMYMGGKEFLQQFLLTKIQTTVDGTTQKEYRLSYQPESGVSRLAAVDLYNRGIKQVNPLTFSYGGEASAATETDVSFIRKNASGKEKVKNALVALDMDGDGICEFGDIYTDYEVDSVLHVAGKYALFDIHRKDQNFIATHRFPVGYSTYYANATPYSFFGDFDGNGAADRIFTYSGNYQPEGVPEDWSVRITDCSDYANPPMFDRRVWDVLKPPFLSVGSCVGNPFSTLVAVFNDPARVSGGFQYHYDVISGGIDQVGLFAPQTRGIIVPSPIEEISLVNLGVSPYRDDLWVKLSDGTYRIFVNSQDKTGFFFSGTPVNPGGAISGDICRFADLNGDGLTDLIYRKADNTWWIGYNKGNYTFDSRKLDLDLPSKFILEEQYAFYSYEEKDNVILLDVNQDGLMDIVGADENMCLEHVFNAGTPDEYRTYAFDNTRWTIYLNVGNGFTKWQEEESSEKAAYSCFGDILGKGTINWVHAKQNKQVVITDFGFSSDPNLLTTIVNPVSGPTNLYYKSGLECNLEITDNHEGSRVNTLKEYLNLGYIPFRTSLCRVFAGSNDGNTEMAYQYGKPLVSWLHRGFVGFRYFEKRDVKKGITELVENSFPLAGRDYKLMLPLVKTTYAGNDRSDRISTETYEYTVKPYASKRYALYPKKQVQTGYLAGETTVTRYYDAYDDYGNILTSRTEGYDQTEQHLYTYGKYAFWCPALCTEDRCTITCKSDKASLSRISSFSYDSRGNLTQVIKDKGDANEKTTLYKNYDVYGHPLRTEEVDPTSDVRISTVAYTPSGRFVSSEVDPLGETVSYQWDEKKGLLLKSTDHMGSTVYTYNKFDEPVSTAYPDGLIEKQSLSWENSISGAVYSRLRSRDDLPGKKVWTYYDKYGREICRETYGHETLSGFSNNEDRKVRVLTEYYPDGGIKRVSKPCSRLEVNWESAYAYDKYGRVLTQETPLGTTTISYGSNFMEEIRPDGKSRTEWNAAGQVARTLTNGKSVRFVYTVGNRVKTAQPESGEIVRMEYDLQGNRTKLVDPDAGTIQTKYDAFGQLRWEKQKLHSNASEITTYYYYSPGGLLEGKVRGDEFTSYTYDAKHRLKETSNQGPHTRSYEYDAYDRPVKITELINGKTFVFRKEYDSSGRLLKEIYPSGYNVVRTYDRNGYFHALKDADSTVVWRKLSSDAQGRITREEKCGVTADYVYNNTEQLTSIKAGNIVDMRYTYAPTGNVLSFTDGISGQTENYRYDAMDRLVSWKKPADSYPSNNLDYDPSRNRIASRYEHLNGGRYDFSYYSANSARLTALENASLPAQDITYTDFKKVKTISQDGESIRFEYGTDEQRVRMSVTARSPLERYYMENYEEEIRSGTLSKIHYIYGGNGLAALYILKPNYPNLYSAFTDRQGSLAALVDKNGMVSQYYSYDPWGNRRNSSNWEKKDTRTEFFSYRGYTMHEHLDGWELINMNGRMYDPYTQNFLNPDPYIQDPSNWLNYNRYAYCMNNPLKYTDPSGDSWVAFAIIFAAGSLNTVSNWGNIDNFWEGLASFGAGAGAAALVMYGGPGGIFGAGILTGAVNDIVSQTGNGVGLGQVNWKQVGISSLTGGVLSYFSYKVGSWVSGNLNIAFNQLSIESPVAKGIVSGAASYAAGGYVGNYVGTLVLTGDPEMAKQNAWKGLYTNLATGAAFGGFGAYQYAKGNNISPWTGKPSVNILKNNAIPEITASDLRLETTMERIYNGKKHSHRNDGSIFINKENILPSHVDGYYREYVHPTLGVKGAGLQRIVIGSNGELYYSPDHYHTFIKFKYK